MYDSLRGLPVRGNLGRALVEGADEVKLFGETIQVRAQIRKLAGLSGHADKEGLIEWIQAFEEKPKRCLWYTVKTVPALHSPNA